MFDAIKTKNDIVDWIRAFFNDYGHGCNAVVGISGGKDSSVTAALCVEALGADRVVGVLMPRGEQYDIDFSREVVSHLKIKSYVVNIKDAVDALFASVSAGGLTPGRQALVNTPARIRMSVLYAVAATVNGRVANTCNLSEDWVGYSTKFGDSAGDFSPLARITVGEVRELGRVLSLPPKIVEKVPEDGLSGKSDEENLGFTYAVLDKYIREGICEDAAIKERIDRLHEENLHKLRFMPCFEL
ncbi:MAG: NAD(+) synthase [Chitinispirillales bacterium]|jgi:NAD+ synthase|nr:NAD(+) synthase [Chitinispirillales bacterium]